MGWSINESAPPARNHTQDVPKMPDYPVWYARFREGVRLSANHRLFTDTAPMAGTMISSPAFRMESALRRFISRI